MSSLHMSVLTSDLLSIRIRSS